MNIEKFTIRDCLRLPMNRWRTAFSLYFKLKKVKGHPPGIMVFQIGTLKSIGTRDRSYLDRAYEDAHKEAPEDVLQNLYGQVLYSLGYHEEGVQRLRTAVEINPSEKNKKDLAIYS